MTASFYRQTKLVLCLCCFSLLTGCDSASSNNAAEHTSYPTLSTLSASNEVSTTQLPDEQLADASSTQQPAEPKSMPDLTPNAEGWISLFNGKNLDGWDIKIRGFDLNDNYGDTFRVKDGKLIVSYDKYKEFRGKYGHIFFRKKFSHYRIRVEYRIVGEQAPKGAGWALRNSGIMLHCQSPASMTKDQKFPVSIEAQLLGGDGKNDRTTGNVCTPGTHIVMNGKLNKQHCISAKSKTYHGEQWVTMEVEVHGNGVIKHFVNGEEVLTYEQPQLDDKDEDAKRLLAAGAEKMLSEGYISLQSESHPIEFRKVEIKLLKEEK